jgi:RHS repeat-associated protein
VAQYSYNNANELTGQSGNVTYTYDNNGNLLTKTVGTSVTSYGWDFENRLTSVTLPGTGGTVAFKYDPFGRRIEKVYTHSGATTTSIYAYDGDNQVEEVDASGNNVVARYVQGLGIDEPLAILRAGVTSYYHADGLGSVNALSQINGSYDEIYKYDSFGVRLSYDGTVTNPFQYTAREFDSETSLLYYRARYYDTTVGRFLSEDPKRFSAGVNFYSYVSNSAPNLTDPLGFFPTRWHRGMTYQQAKEVFGPGCEDKAKIVADANEAVDHPWWSLLNPLGSAWRYGGPHFPISNYGDALVDNAIKTCNLTSLGRGLHTLQDGIVHPKGPLGPLVHVLVGPLADWTGGTEGIEATAATRVALQSFKDKCLACCKGASTTVIVAQ